MDEESIGKAASTLLRSAVEHHDNAVKAKIVGDVLEELSTLLTSQGEHRAECLVRSRLERRIENEIDCPECGGDSSVAAAQQARAQREQLRSLLGQLHNATQDLCDVAETVVSDTHEGVELSSERTGDLRQTALACRYVLCSCGKLQDCQSHE
jgi:hypothetical protein